MTHLSGLRAAIALSAMATIAGCTSPYGRAVKEFAVPRLVRIDDATARTERRLLETADAADDLARRLERVSIAPPEPVRAAVGDLLDHIDGAAWDVDREAVGILDVTSDPGLRAAAERVGEVTTPCQALVTEGRAALGRTADGSPFETGPLIAAARNIRPLVERVHAALVAARPK